MNLWGPRQSFREAVFPGRSPRPLPFNKTQISSGSPSNPLLFLDPLMAPPFTQSITRPDPWVLFLPPPTPFYPQLSAPSSIPDSRPPDSLYLVSSSTIPSSALFSPAWTLGIQSVSPVCPLCGPREAFLHPELTSSAHSPLWLASALGQSAKPSVQHSRPWVIWSCPRPLGCFTAALAWLDRDS